VSEPQSRLFGMLLQSMQLEPVPARFFELAQQLDAGKLKQLIQALNHQDQQSALMIDALILARLDSPLGQAQAELLAELLDCFGLSNDQAGHVTTMVNMGLGLPIAVKSMAQVEKLSKFSPMLKLAYPDFLLRQGVYVDSASNLMWSRISIGQQWMIHKDPNGTPRKMDWSDAKKACKDWSLAGFDDWRLPTIKELSSIGSQTHAANMLYPEPKTAKVYWSSSKFEEQNHASVFRFGYGSNEKPIQTFNVEKGSVSSEDRNSSCYVRAVRSIR